MGIKLSYFIIYMILFYISIFLLVSFPFEDYPYYINQYNIYILLILFVLTFITTAYLYQNLDKSFFFNLSISFMFSLLTTFIILCFIVGINALIGTHQEEEHAGIVLEKNKYTKGNMKYIKISSDNLKMNIFRDIEEKEFNKINIHQQYNFKIYKGSLGFYFKYDISNK